jgi:hypothetical protein
MKKLILLPFVALNFLVYSQLTYVNNFDGVYPYVSLGSSTYNLDINSDGQNDVLLKMAYSNNVFASCNIPGVGSISCTSSVKGVFEGITNSFGTNKINSTIYSGNTATIDCSGDTLNNLDSWINGGFIYYGCGPGNFCLNIGIGTHKQGFRLILTNPINGTLGYKYGYINYSFGNTGDIIIHGWYYENTFNVPIVANSQLQYPYDGNCVHYDTVTVQDTITTQIFDTITTHINVYDTVLVTVTDTLIINTSLGLPAPNDINTISVYPNPTNDHITIDNGNFALMPNYSIKIENSLGQQVFSSLINQQLFYIDLTGWSGNGVYFLKLINPQNNIVTIRKIVLQ